MSTVEIGDSRLTSGLPLKGPPLEYALVDEHHVRAIPAFPKSCPLLQEETILIGGLHIAADIEDPIGGEAKPINVQGALVRVA
jgi:hypothetical protein